MSDALDWAGISKAIQNWVVAGSGLAADHVFWAFEGKPRPSAPYIEMAVQTVRPIGHDWSTYSDNLLEFDALVVSAIDAAADTLTIANHGLANGDGPVRVTTTGTLPGGLAADTDYWVILVDANTIKLAASYVATGGALPGGAGNPVTQVNVTSSGFGVLKVEHTDETVPAGKELIHEAQGFREVAIHFECFAQEGRGYDATRILTNVLASLQLHVYELDQAGVGVSDFGQAFAQGGVSLLEGHRGSILEPRAMTDLTIYVAANVTGFETIIDDIDPISIPTGTSWSYGFGAGFGG